jgi:hypothetical protein
MIEDAGFRATTEVDPFQGSRSSRTEARWPAPALVVSPRSRDLLGWVPVTSCAAALAARLEADG